MKLEVNFRDENPKHTSNLQVPALTKAPAPAAPVKQFWDWPRVEFLNYRNIISTTPRPVGLIGFVCRPRRRVLLSSFPYHQP